MAKHFRRLQLILATGFALPQVLVAAPALADGYSVQISNYMDIGQVTSGSNGTTIFRLNPSSGQVSQISGNGRRLSNSIVRVLVTVTCSDDNHWVDSDDHDQGRGNDKINCAKDRPWITIGPLGLATGRALPLTNFTVSMTSASLAGGVNGSAPILFQLNPIGTNQSRSFYVGADFPVAGDETWRPSGEGLSPYFVSVSDGSGDAYTTRLSAGRLVANRAMAIDKRSDLRFGIVSRAATSGMVTIDPETGNRTVTGGGYGYPSPAWGPAEFTITGEGGQAFSVHVPQTIQLAGPTNLNVQTTTNLPSSPVLSSAPGSAGTFTLKVGGAFPIANGSLTGTYSGNWTVTVDYN